MDILLLGKSGQIGFELKRTLAPLGKIKAPSSAELDLTDTAVVDRYLIDIAPSVIVNAAAWTNVDGAESEPEVAYQLNTQLPRAIANYCKKNDCKVVHYSSDYVYPGSGKEEWLESSDTHPVNYYGQTKLEGDNAIIESDANYLIFRTSWVYSARRNNFMKTMLRLAETKKELSIINDQIGAPTTARLIAQTTALSLYGNLEKGVYNLATKGEVSWCQFAKEIFKKASLRGKSFALESVSSIPTTEYPTPAPRPLNSRLNTSKLESALGIKLPFWEDELADTLEEYLEEK